MAEVFAWNEGSAYLWTGNSTTSALFKFTRGIRLGLSINRHSYRVPFATVRTWTEIERQAVLNVTQAYSEKTGLSFLYAGTGGQIHAHVFYLTPGPGVSGGFILNTGTLSDGTFDGNEAQAEQPLGLSMTFERWTAY